MFQLQGAGGQYIKRLLAHNIAMKMRDDAIMEEGVQEGQHYGENFSTN